MLLDYLGTRQRKASSSGSLVWGRTPRPVILAGPRSIKGVGRVIAKGICITAHGRVVMVPAFDPAEIAVLFAGGVIDEYLLAALLAI